MTTCVATETIGSTRSSTNPFLPINHQPTDPPPHDTSYKLVDELTALYPETPEAFHCLSGKFVTPLVEEHMPRTSVVLALARLGGRGS